MKNLDNNSNNSDESLSILKAANPVNYNANSRLLVRVLNEVLSQRTDLTEITTRMETLLNKCIDYDDELDYERIVYVLTGNFEAYLEKLNISEINLVNKIKEILAIFADKYGIKLDLEAKNNKAFEKWKQKKKTPTIPYFSLPGDEEQPPSVRFDLPEEEPAPKPKPETTGLSTEGSLSSLGDDAKAYAQIMQVKKNLERNEAVEEFREAFEEIFYDRFSLDDHPNLWEFLADANVIRDAINELLTDPEGRYTHFADYYDSLPESGIEKFHSYLRKYAFETLRNNAISSVEDIIALDIPEQLYDETLGADDDELPELAVKIADYFREKLIEQKNSGEYDITLRRLLFFYTKGISKVDGTAGSDSEGSQLFGLGRWNYLLDEIIKVMEKLRGSKPIENDKPPRHESRTKTEIGIGIPAQREPDVDGEDGGIEESNQAIKGLLDDELSDEEKPDTSYSLIGEDAESLEDTVVMPIPVAPPQEKEVESIPSDLPKQAATLEIPDSPLQEEIVEPMPVPPAQEKVAEPIPTPPPQKEIPLPKPTPPPRRQPEPAPIQAKKRRPVPDYETPTVPKRKIHSPDEGAEDTGKTVQKRRRWVKYAVAAVVAVGSVVAGIAIKKLSDENLTTAHITSSSTATGATAKPSAPVKSSKVKSAEIAASASTTAASPTKSKTPETTEGGALDEEIGKKAIPERVKELARRFPRIDKIINGKLVSNRNRSGIGAQIFSPFYDGASAEQRVALSKKKAEFNKSSGDYIRVNYNDPEKRNNILGDPTHPDHFYAKSVSKYINLGKLPRPDGSESITQFKTFMEEMRKMEGIENVNSVLPNTELEVSELSIVLELARIRFPEAFTDKDTDEDPSKGKQGFKPLQDNDTYDLNHTIEHMPDQPAKYANNAVCNEGAVTEQCQQKIQPGSSKNVDISFMHKKLAEAEQKKAYANLMTEAINKAKHGDILSTVPDTSDIDAKWELPPANVKNNVYPGSGEKVNMDHIRAGAAQYTESQQNNISRHLRLPQSFIVDRTKGELSLEILERQIQNSGQPENVVNAVMGTLEECENGGLLFTMQSLEGSKARFSLKTDVRCALDEAADNAVKEMKKAA